VRELEQPPQERLLLDEPGVIARVAGGRDRGGELVHGGLPAGRLELAAPLELCAHREGIDPELFSESERIARKIAACESR
jgi:hypothetical protein